TSSATTAAYGATVVFTATVKPVAPGGGKPTGTVTFFIDGAARATLALNANGQAALAVNSLRPGAHAVSAVYNGSANFFRSPPAPALTETIAMLPVSTFSLAASAPGGLRAGAPFTVQVFARDFLGDLVTSYGAPVTLTLVRAPAGGAITGTLSGRFVNGVATFAGLRVTKPGTYVVSIFSGNVV